MEVQKNKAHFSLHKSNVFLVVCFSPCKTSCSWQSPAWCCCWAARNWSWFRPHRRPPHQNSYCWIFLHRQEGGAAERERKCQTFPSCKLILPICRHIYSQLCGVWPGMIFCNFPDISLPHDVGLSVFKAHTHTPQQWQRCHCPSYSVTHPAAKKAAGQTRCLGRLLWVFNPKLHLKEIGNGKM